jgi:hypothetical protein
MQIAVFEMVKRGLSIDAALAKARMLETSFDREPATRDMGGMARGDLKPEVHACVRACVHMCVCVCVCLCPLSARTLTRG